MYYHNCFKSKIKKIVKDNTFSLIDLDKKTANSMQIHFRLNNYQMLVIIWIKGVWTGLLISLIIHYFLTQ